MITIAEEKTFETKVKNFLNTTGAYTLKWHGNAFSGAGIPDLIVCLKGKYVAVELKAHNGTVSDLQLYNLSKIAEAGGIAIILYPSGYNDFKRIIMEISCNLALSTNYIILK